jgi:hypothetical protein
LAVAAGVGGTTSCRCAVLAQRLALRGTGPMLAVPVLPCDVARLRVGLVGVAGFAGVAFAL